MEFQKLKERALQTRQQYAGLERVRYGRSWTGQELALGFVGDVGDLMKLVQATSGVRDIPDARARLAHELADCLWSVLVLADAYGVDVERAFLDTMDDLEQRLSTQGLGVS
jgi:NTP pyrophosphatase (non-canonical NTP hydrolase)